MSQLEEHNQPKPQKVFAIFHPLHTSTCDTKNEDGLYSRKDKSLFELCRKFLTLYGTDQTCTVDLNQCIQQLGVERRRIYDIVNILESLSVVSKKCKNIYEWKGYCQLEKEITNFESSFQLEHNSQFLISGSDPNQREKSLKYLCSYFISYIIQSGKVVSLIQCANHFIQLYEDGSCVDRVTSIIRRLYDIANVLSSLGLLEKHSESTQKKPVFKWLGRQGLICTEKTPVKSKVFRVFKAERKCHKGVKILQHLLEEGAQNKLSMLSLKAILAQKCFYVKSSLLDVISPEQCKSHSMLSTAEKSPESPLKRKCLEFHVSALKDISNYCSDM